ncbi:zinc finger MYM-type protein 5-like [Hydra vulgaris]|uniref:Zinc finger MYM-type protein 5-like n=1 Tax=Hydra vulgaris TaxID=6087 RepID=A0ABM4CU39_HYDVU
MGRSYETECHGNSPTSANLANCGIIKEAKILDFVEDSINETQTSNEQSELNKERACFPIDLPLNRKSDSGLWEILSAEDIQFWIENGPLKCQNADYDFKFSKMMYQDRDRYCSKSLLMGKKVNGETFNREWVIYSPALGCVFCIVCKLFEPSKCALVSTGYKDWKNSGASILGHEHSSDHRKTSLAYFHRKNNKVF